MRLPRHPALWLALFGIWFGVTWWLSSAPRDFPSGLDFRASDKVLHFGWYFGGCGLFSAALFRLRPELPTARRILIAVAVVALCGIIDEFHQATVPGRDATIGDFLADTLGALAGAIVFQKIHKILA
ncbi:VanZ family protein [Haloferula sp.]|uniref:VanZ family protein n=1 Tax=Haloferula sp. TaxID=2497595 RepID=UPI0032A0041F